MDEMNGAFEEKKRRKGGKRLMQPEKAAKAPKAPRAEKPLALSAQMPRLFRLRKQTPHQLLTLVIQQLMPPARRFQPCFQPTPSRCRWTI